MRTRIKVWTFCAVLSVSAFGYADSVPDVLTRGAIDRLPVQEMGAEAFSNPALMPLKREWSVSRAEISFERDVRRKAIIPQLGRGKGVAGLSADAYIKTGKAAIYGDAGYECGTLFDMQWNECGEYEKVYPYVIATEVGGNLRMEKYLFHGGYSRLGDKISWGVEGGYTALLSYRNVDPRPKNTSGDLRIKAGIGWHAPFGYVAAIAGEFGKYRLSTDMEFMSEMGEAKVYHMTGLGQHYVRFAGQGKNVYSDSYTWGVSLNIAPTEISGLYLSGRFQRETMEHVIVDLNKLPMASLWQNTLGLEATWRQRIGWHTLAAEARYDWHRRHGTENIFGDAASGSYPQIGSIEMYADNYYRAAGELLWQYSPEFLHVWGRLTGDWLHSKQDYLSPRLTALSESWKLGLDAGADWRISPKISADIRGGVERRWRISGEFPCLTTASAEAGVAYAFNSKYALGLRIGYRHLSAYGNDYKIKLQFIF